MMLTASDGAEDDGDDDDDGELCAHVVWRPCVSVLVCECASVI